MTVLTSRLGISVSSNTHPSIHPSVLCCFFPLRGFEPATFSPRGDSAALCPPSSKHIWQNYSAARAEFGALITDGGHSGGGTKIDLRILNETKVWNYVRVVIRSRWRSKMGNFCLLFKSLMSNLLSPRGPSPRCAERGPARPR